MFCLKTPESVKMRQISRILHSLPPSLPHLFPVDIKHVWTLFEFKQQNNSWVIFVKKKWKKEIGKGINFYYLVNFFFFVYTFTHLKQKKYNHQVRKYQCTSDTSKKGLNKEQGIIIYDNITRNDNLR